MALPDGARTKRLPTLSWDSVVDAGGSADDHADLAGESDTAPASIAEDDAITLTPLELDLTPLTETDEPSVELPVVFAPLEIDVTPQPAAPDAPAFPPTPATIEPPDEPLTVRSTPPAVIVPAIGDVTSGPEQLATPPVENVPAALAAPAAPGPDAAPALAAPAAPAPDAGPALAAPAAPAPDAGPALAAPAAPAPDAATAPSITDPLPEIQEATPVVEPSAPLLPSIPIPVPSSSPAASFEFDSASVAPAPIRQPQRRTKRRGFKLVVTLLVLGGVIAAGIVFGQEYLFPGDWDDATAPYAEAVETVSGVEFAEPLAIVAEPIAAFTTRMQAQVASVPPEELAQWRALGLASGVVDDATLAGQIAGWQDALYSTSDGQVYSDLGVAGPELDAQLVQEMASASLDQQYGWSVEQPERTLDAAAATSAEVLRQSRAVQRSSTFAAPVPSVPSEATVALPPAIGYQMLAPHVFAEFESSIEPTEGSNVLDGLGTSGPGILGRDLPVMATDPTMLDGDVVVASPDCQGSLLLVSRLRRLPRSANRLRRERSNRRELAHRRCQRFDAVCFGDILGWRNRADRHVALGADCVDRCCPGRDGQLVPSAPRWCVAAGVLRPRRGVRRPHATGPRPRVACVADSRTRDAGGGTRRWWRRGRTDCRMGLCRGQSQVPLDLMNVPPTATPGEMATAARTAVGDLFAFLG